MIKCLIVDDEPLALELLEDFIKQMPMLALVASCSNAAQAAAVMNEQAIDLLFLDIHMPGMNGITFLKSLKMHQRPMVVFTTAYHQYALEGFDLNVLDYLMKPIAFERFLKTVHKAIGQMEKPSGISITLPKKDFLFIKSEYKTFKVNVDDIIYIEGLKDYAKIYTTTGNILTLKSLKAIEAMLPGDEFVRVHRSYIIAIKKIKMISRNQITLSNEVSIPLSEGYKEELNNIINSNQV